MLIIVIFHGEEIAIVSGAAVELFLDRLIRSDLVGHVVEIGRFVQPGRKGKCRFDPNFLRNGRKN